MQIEWVICLKILKKIKFSASLLKKYNCLYVKKGEKVQGTVKWFSEEKGFGFITCDAGEDYYVNVQGIKGASLPSNGDSVTFESRPGKKGPRAVNVIITSKCTLNSIERTDDRVSCPGCGKKIIPRIITRNGRPTKSVCPYCAGMVRDFREQGCFIATAVYGDPSCFQVIQLRKFRDEKLLTNPAGRVFVKLYNEISPPIAFWLKRQKLLPVIIRNGLDRIVVRISKK